MKLFERYKRKKPDIYYNPQYHKPVIRCSICTGEQVAGFKDRETGHFTDVICIENPQDLELFKKMYGITGEIEKEY